MLIHPIPAIQEKINKAAKQREPFLFAVDYALTEGLFISHPLDQKEVLWRVPGQSNAPLPSGVAQRDDTVSFEAHPEPKENYAKRFSKVYNHQ